MSGDWIITHLSKLKNKQWYDRNVRNVDIRPGDLVLLKVMKLLAGQCAKFTDKYIGPFEVMSQVSDVNFIIKSHFLCIKINMKFVLQKITKIGQFNGTEARLSTTKRCKRYV